MTVTKMKWIFLSMIVIALGLLAWNALAQTTGDFGLTAASTFGLPNVDLVTFISRIIRVFLSLVVIIVILMIILAGFRWMVAGGDDEKRKKAQSALINSIIGLIIVIGAYAIVSFVIRALMASSV